MPSFAPLRGDYGGQPPAEVGGAGVTGYYLVRLNLNLEKVGLGNC